MILSNDSILKSNMISDFEQKSLKNCSYKIRVGDIFEPETGKVIDISTNGYLLKPSEIVIIQSLEKFELPKTITASYSSLNSLSMKGVLLINSSMIEPGYSGHLSAYFLNFSAQPVLIQKEKEYAKINFIKVSGDVSNFEVEKIGSGSYNHKLQGVAMCSHKSFLNITDMSDKIKNKILSDVNEKVKIGGYIIALLIVFATLQPLFSNWIWEKMGSFSSKKYKYETLLREIKVSQEKLDKTLIENNKVLNLQKRIDNLENELKKYKNAESYKK